MADTDRRCPYCHAAVKQRAFRCAACGSLIGRKNKNIPSIEPEQGKMRSLRIASRPKSSSERRALSTTVQACFCSDLWCSFPWSVNWPDLSPDLCCSCRVKAKTENTREECIYFNTSCFSSFGLPYSIS